MDAEETKSAAAVMLAWAEGKKIQLRFKGQVLWIDADSPKWNFEERDYRIAPEPVEVEVWVHHDGNVATSDMVPHNRPQDYGWTLRRATIHPEQP